MRLRSIFGTSLLLFIMLMLMETDSRAQFGFGGFDMKNPESMFNAYAQKQGNTDFLEIDKVQSRMDPELSTKMKAFATKAGNSSGKMTKEQFAEFWTKDALPQLEEKMKSGPFGGFGRGQGGPPGSAPGGPMAPGGPASAAGTPPGGPASPGGPGGGFGRDRGGFGRGPGGPGGPGGEKTAGTTASTTTPTPSTYQPRPFDEEEATGYFKRMDQNTDNSLSAEEYGRSDIRRELEKWDANKNGTVEMAEWLAYMKSRHDKKEEERKQWEDFRAARNSSSTTTTTTTSITPYVPTSPVPLMPDKLVITRADNLPKELPAWFKELDTDKDGQVGLYEWKAGSKDMAEYLNYDRNGDGLITPEEVLWYTKNSDRLAGIIPTGPAASASVKAPSTSTSGRPARMNLFGGGGGGETVAPPEKEKEKEKGKDRKSIFGGFGKGKEPGSKK